MDRIRSTLELIRDQLNAYFSNADPTRDDPWVILSNIVDNEGRPYTEAEGKIVMFLANIQNETTISTYSSTTPVARNQYAVVTPPHYINLYILFYANCVDQKYSDGLELISGTISFFQQNPYFTHDTLPDLDPVIDKLSFDLSNLDLTELNYLMGMVGVKYLPSVYYKVRMIPYESDAMKAGIPAVQGIEAPGELDDTVEPTD